MPEEQLSLIPPEAQEAQDTCLGNLGTLLKQIGVMNRAETGQNHNSNPDVAAHQADQYQRLKSGIPEFFTQSRAWAKKQYSQLGAKMCEGCLGRGACPLRTYDSDNGPTPHINPDSDNHHVLAGLQVWYGALKPNAKRNIQNHRVTPVTIEQSRTGTSCAHKAAA